MKPLLIIDLIDEIGKPGILFLKVLKLIAEGRKSGEVANLLDIAVKTVLGHRTSMMRKLGVHNRTELVKCVIRK